MPLRPLTNSNLECFGCNTPLYGRQKKWCSANCQKKEARRAWIWKVYAITLEEYDTALAFQDGKCAICGKPPKANTVLHIDHEHGGYNRGLLCGYCNTRLVGRLKNHDLAQKLADYLRDPPMIKALGRGIVAPGRPKKKRQPRTRRRGN